MNQYLLFQLHKRLKPPSRQFLHRPLDLEHGQGGQDVARGDLGALHHLVGGQGVLLQGGDDLKLIVGKAVLLLFAGDHFTARRLPAGRALRLGALCPTFFRFGAWLHLSPFPQPLPDHLRRQRRGGGEFQGKAVPVFLQNIPA